MHRQLGLRRVMSNPLLLRLAVAVHLDSDMNEVAVNRAELYRCYVEEVVWQRAQARKKDSPWNQTQVEAALETVAWVLHTKGPQTTSELGKEIESANQGIKD